LFTDVARVTEEEVPAGQFSLEVVVGQYWPGAQGSQSSSDVAPRLLCVVPSGQFLGEPEPAGQ
jgi:hypothetical protein